MIPRAMEIDVRGMPRPQGSMRMHRLPNGGTATRYPPAVYEWRAQVQQAAAMAIALADEPRFDGPVELVLSFDLPRPRGHFGTGRNADSIKHSAPQRPASIPDLDKLTRCVSDALTDSGIWKDDGQVVAIHASKWYADVPGVAIVVRDATA